MSSPWSKRYTFRLQAQDEDLCDFLENLPTSKRSQVIRNMLRFAYDFSLETRKQNELLQKLIQRMDELTEGQKRILEKMERIDTVPVVSDPSVSQHENKNQAMRESAMAFLNLFEQG